jgi:uncharacterized membrane protein YccC
LLFGVRLWVSVCLALYIAFWLELDNAYWAGTTAALVCQPQLGASLRKGWYRMTGTLVGAVAIVMLTACFPQQRAAFLVGLALWCAACALVSTLLRNFAAYSVALAGYTAAIIASDQLGATGGLNGDAFMLAVTRTSEICIGIVCAGLVLAGTDFGAAARRLAELLAPLSTDIACRFAGTLLQSGSESSQMQPVRRDLIRRVVELDPVIDETIGESSRFRYHSPALHAAMDGLFSALAGWRVVAIRLARLPYSAARQEADLVLQHVPQELQSNSPQEMSMHWLAGPVILRQRCDAAVQALIALPASTPSLRLLSDQTAEVLVGMSDALEGLALLVADPRRARSHSRRAKLHVPDWLPALVNAGRAFIAICAVEVFWIVTAWPNGALAITWTAISVVLFAASADEAYTSAMKYMIGTGLAAVCAAIIGFAVLPRIETFEAFSAAMAVYFVPVGALMAQPWQVAMFAPMAGNFIPLLAPTNAMSYDTVQFYNAALAIVTGCAVAALSFRLLPPLSPAMRTRRLLALTLRDLRRLATSSIPVMIDDWRYHIYSRLEVLPDQAEPLQRAQLVAALSVGSETIRLRRIVGQHLAKEDLDAGLAALAQGNTEEASRRLAVVDRDLASASGEGLAAPEVLRARASILAISDAFSEHASYFGAGART